MLNGYALREDDIMKCLERRVAEARLTRMVRHYMLTLHQRNGKQVGQVPTVAKLENRSVKLPCGGYAILQNGKQIGEVFVTEKRILGRTAKGTVFYWNR
jgi:hypothetical protein